MVQRGGKLWSGWADIVKGRYISEQTSDGRVRQSGELRGNGEVELSANQRSNGKVKSKVR